MSENIVGEWLRSLRLTQYAESFLDNGYDDLEICKQIGEPDLDAIGVHVREHRAELLRAVKTLREHGGTAVYFTLEETLAAAAQAGIIIPASSANTVGLPEVLPNVIPSGGPANNKEHGCSANYSTYMYDDELAAVVAGKRCLVAAAQDLASPVSGGGLDDPTAAAAVATLEQSLLFRKYLDEYEEGKAELAKIPRLQLKGLLREKLAQDGVHLSSPPYSNADGSKGYLDGLAVKYAGEFKTLYQDVAEHLESLRRKAVEEAMSSQVKLAPALESVYQATPSSSHSSPAYKPGRYSPSSCLSDQEEEEIYGYGGYGVYARRIYKHHANRLACLATPQRCVTPRSQCFYEPCASYASASELKDPGENPEPSKKRGPLGRIFRGLALKREKDKNKDKDKGSNNNPRHLTPTKSLPPRIPDPNASIYEGLYGSREVRAAAEERMKLVLMVKDGQISMEQAFDKMCQYEPYKWKTTNQDEILKDFRHGVFSSMSPHKKESKETAKFYTSVDSGQNLRFGQHWYDDPPYESDPDEMALCPAKTSLSMPYVETGSKFPNGSCIQDTDDPPPSSWVYSGDSVIMTRTAGDIQVSREQIRTKDPSSLSPNRQPQQHRLSGGGGGGGGQRISNCSVETTGSSKRDSMESPKEDTGPSSPILGKKNKMFSKIKNITGRTNANPSPVSASEEALSLSSDYEDQDDAERKMERRLSRDVSGRASTFVGRVKGFGNDVKKKISKLRPSRTVSESEASDPNANIEATIGTSASSAESIPSGSGSSVQALTTSSSNRSSTSVEEEVPPYTGPFIGKARAIVDYTPSPYDKDALKFKKGDVIDIISMSQTGSWTGMVSNRVGHFKFINVEPLPEAKPRPRRSQLPRRRNSKRGKPKSVEELLQRINLEEHISVFVLNGYEHLDLFKELEEEDLDYLGISDPEHRAKILTAVELLHDYDSPDSPDAEDEPITDESFPEQSDASKVSGDSVLVPKHSHSPRDSGCYASNENLPNRESLQRGNTPAGSGDISQSESGIHSSDGMDPLTPALSNNLDRREVAGMTCLPQQTMSNGNGDGETISHVTTRAVIEVVPKQHGYLPNILPAAGIVYLEGEPQGGETESGNSGLVNGCVSNEDSDSSSSTPAWFKASVDNSLRGNDSKCCGGVGSGTTGERNCSAYEYRTLGSSRFTAENDDKTLTNSSPARCSSPPLRRDVASLAHAFRSQSLDRPSSPLLGGGGTFSPGTLRGRSLAGLRPPQLAQQSIPPTSTAAVPAGDGSSPLKSVTMPRKPVAPSKIKIPHLPAPLGNRKVIAFKEPSASPSKGKLKPSRTPRPVSATLDAMLQRKLQDEMIDLAQEPYTDKSGFCAIPPALVQRYSDEVKRDIKEVADALDQIRIACLQQRGRQGVPNDFLADSCMSSVQDQTNYESLEAWLASIGLPMYADTLRCSGHGQLNDLCQLGEVDLRACGVNNPLHLRRILTEIEALNIHLQKFAC